MVSLDTSTQASTSAEHTQPQESAKTLLTPDAVSEKYADILQQPLELDRLGFGYKILKLLDTMPTKVEADSEWYVLPMKWYNQWEKYCYSDLLLD